MAYVDYFSSINGLPSGLPTSGGTTEQPKRHYYTNNNGRTTAHHLNQLFLPPPPFSSQQHTAQQQHQNYTISPSPLISPTSQATTLCPFCYLPFNPTLSYMGQCPNCTNFKVPPTLSPTGSTFFTNHVLSTNSSGNNIIRPPIKKSTSSLSSSGSSSSSITSPDYSSHVSSTCNNNNNNETFSMSTLLNVVDDVLREDHSDIFTAQNPPINQSLNLTCFSCRSTNESLSFCVDCQTNICTPCLTSFHPSDHRICTRLASPLSPPLPTPPPPSSLSISQSFSNTPVGTTTINNTAEEELLLQQHSLPTYKDTCDVHTGQPVEHFCKTCLILLCRDCIQERGHSSHCHITIKEAHSQLQTQQQQLYATSFHDATNLYNRINGLCKASENIDKLTNSVIQNKDETIAEIQRLFRIQREELARRESEVIASVNSITNKRLTSLENEKHDVDLSRKLFADLNLQLNARNATPPVSSEQQKATAMFVLTHYKIEKEMQVLSLSDLELLSNGRQSAENDSLLLLTHNSPIQTSINTYCQVTTPPHPPNCILTGEGLFHTQANRSSTVLLTTKDRMGDSCKEGGERVLATLSQGGGVQGAVSLDITDNMDGTYVINFRPRHKGEYTLSVTIKGHHVKGSPYKLNVKLEQEYCRVGVVSRIFGSEGSGPGEFCRPWGICCDQKGHIIIGDRSNHRIQVFDSDGRFLHMFGSEGRHTGQFNRPAGVAVTREGHIVVADKDNHRIQIFKFDGTFLFTFGKKGGKDGEMVYPYDVAVSPVDGRIVTTDTGNHRILIFNAEGLLLGKFGYKGYLCNHFDSPRGIAINREGHIVVSDFNVHHVLIIHPDGTTARILGSQGTGNAQFTRPQGIAVDHSGNFVIADTRNNRIVIMHPSGGFITKFGSQGSGRGQFDRPTAVTVLPDRRIAVMDFGNSRIQIF